MSTTFTIPARGAGLGTGPRFHASFSRTKLTISGHINMSGPQVVSDDGGVPQWVAEAFDRNPKLKQLALNGDDSGVVYQRMGVQP